MKIRYFILLMFLATSLVHTQISFTNSNALLENQSAHSGVAIVISDVNGDGLDDIVRLDNGTDLQIEYQRSDQSGFDLYTFGAIAGGSQWSMCVGDVDNNGFNDILAGGVYDNIKIAMASADGNSYQLSTLPIPTLFAQGTNLVDINNDGHLDYFACHDDAESVICGNDGNGNLLAADWIDMATSPPSDNSGNYGSVWTDFDGDGDLDLYIAKCRSGASDSSDPRRINQLFVNDGDGNFTEAAAAANLKIGAQSWSAEFQDIDNDGDLDCFVTNHDVPSMLLENDGTGVFTDITVGSGLDIGGVPIQGAMRDFDNDGWMDILVAGTVHFLYHNNGDRTFTVIENPFGVEQMESYGIGDLNHDGYLDIYAGYANLYTSPSNIDDVLWLNDGGNNHYLSMQLIGTISNRNGIGAWVEAHGSWGVQIREVRSGESYGIGHSLMPHFGLGTNTVVDSLVIKWPSGIIDIYTDVEADQCLTIIENNCISIPVEITTTGSTIICEGETVQLNAPADFSYQWSNGATTPSINVGTAGDYALTVSDATGCLGIAAAVNVIVNPDETPSVFVEGDTTFCMGGNVNLQASEAASYEWSTGELTAAIQVTESGVYTVTVPGQCASFSSLPISVNVLAAPVPVIEDITHDLDEVVVNVSGNNVSWYAGSNDMTSLTTGNQATFPIMGGDTSFVVYAETETIYEGGTFAAGMEAHMGAPYSGNQYNGGIFFDCLEKFTLQSVRVYTDTEATRTIELLSEGIVVASKEINIPVGEHIIPLDFVITPGTDYFLSTNENQNLSNLGFESPRLQRSNENVNYPYTIEDVISMTGSNLGESRYYYFFDWQIKLDDVSCTSERVPFLLDIVDAEDVAIQEVKIGLSPNPSTGLIQLELPEILREGAELQVFHTNGQHLLSQQISGFQTAINLGHLAAGIYWIEVREGNLIGREKVVIIK